MKASDFRLKDGVHNPVSKHHAINLSSLVLLVVFFSMFSRTLTAMGVPSVVNFLHFLLVTILFSLSLTKVRENISVGFIGGLLSLLMLLVISALINGAGLINIVLDFLLLSEPFMLLFVMTSVRWKKSSYKRFQFWLIVIVSIHIIISYYQGVVLGHNSDDVVGLFLNMGAGSHIAGAFSLTAAVYVLFVLREWPFWFKVGSSLACFGVVILSDSKQVIAVFLVALIIMFFLKTSDLKKAVKYLLLAITLITVVIIAANTIFPALNTWSQMSLLVQGVEQKFSVFSIIISYYDSFSNWLFGLGPGHSVGRLGFLANDYSDYLQPLGITNSLATNAVWNAHQGHFISNSITGSSMFSLFFSWAGVWGDLGMFGLVVYLSLWWQVWRKVCVDDISKYFLLTILVFGSVFSWMEEPEYMIFMVCVIGLRWQNVQRTKQ